MRAEPGRSNPPTSSPLHPLEKTNGWAQNEPIGGSLLDAGTPAKGVNFARRFTPMTELAYIRVSSVGQSLDVQRDKVLAVGVEPKNVFEEKRSGLDTGRPELKACLRALRSGDTLVITRIDRLARSAVDLLTIVKQLEREGVSLKVLDQAIDTSTPAGKALLQMLAVFAEFETAIRSERQMDGIAKAKAKGVRFGRRA